MYLTQSQEAKPLALGNHVVDVNALWNSSMKTLVRFGGIFFCFGGVLGLNMSYNAVYCKWSKNWS